MRPLQYLLASNLLVPQNDSLEHSRLEELDSTEFSHKERWQSGRMRVFAKDVTGQKLVHGFESRPLRFLTCTTLRTSHDNPDIFYSKLETPWHNLFSSFVHSLSLECIATVSQRVKAKHRLCRIIFHHMYRMS